MAEAPSTSETAKPVKAPKPKLVGAELAAKRSLRRKLKAAGRKKRSMKMLTNKEHAKAVFDARSKRSVDKKQAFRKKKSRKK